MKECGAPPAVHLRIGVSSRLGLHLDVVLGGTLDKARHVLSILRARHGDGLDGDCEVVAINPVDLVQERVWVGDTVGAAIADCIQAALQASRLAGTLAHGDASDVIAADMLVVGV